jgi:hypothetical protein
MSLPEFVTASGAEPAAQKQKGPDAKSIQPNKA